MEKLLRSARDYLVAIAVVGVALAFRLAILGILENRRPYLTLFGGVALAVWLTRWKPASVAALIGFLAAHRLFVPQGDSVHLGFFAAELATYTLSAGFIIFMGESLHRARERAEREASDKRGAEESERRQEATAAA